MRSPSRLKSQAWPHRPQHLRIGRGKCHHPLPAPVVQCAHCGVQSELRGDSNETPRCLSCDAYLTGALRGVLPSRGREYDADLKGGLDGEHPVNRGHGQRLSREPVVMADASRVDGPSHTHPRKSGFGVKKLLQGAFGLMWMAGFLGNGLLFLFVEWTYLRDSFLQFLNPFLHLQVLLRLVTIPLFWILLMLTGVGYFAMAGVEKTFEDG